MSGLDIFAYIVLVVLALSTVAVICIMGWLPGHIARDRGHPWAREGRRFSQVLATFKEYPPRQRAASFSVNQIVEQMQKSLSAPAK
jgi:hypothetical protein